MSDNSTVPTPPLPLENHCSAIWNNTLYVYSPKGFQSIALEKGAKWKQLDSGQSVTGAQCVPARNPGSEALYIVGGTPDASAALSNFSGLQRYKFESMAWETITPTVPITQNRVKHGAAFISSLNSILVYSGTQDPSGAGLSTQTFLISTAPPFDVLSFNSQGAPALNAPMIMPWSADQAVVIGGAADNTQVWLFGQPQGFTNLGTTLPAGLGLDSPTKQCTVVTGDDGSKVLEIYDLGASPNQVTRLALFVNGKPAPVGQEVGTAQPSSGRRLRRRSKARRALTLADWPAYNSTLAPTTSRSGFSLAESEKGLAVISGGNNEQPIALFDQESNAWMDPTKFFVEKQQQSVLSSPTSSLPVVSTVSATPTATSSAPTSSATSPGVLGTGQSKSKVLTTLGATLGAIFGIAALLIIILMLLRWKKQKRRRAAGRMNEKEDRLSFADQGADFMSEAQGARSRGYSGSKSANSSLTSLAIFGGGHQSKSPGHRRGIPSDSSQAPITKNKSPLGVSDPMEMAHISQRSSPTFTNRSADFEKSDYSPPKTAVLAPAVAATAKNSKDERSRSNGWSRYFANNDVQSLAAMQADKRNTYETQASEMSRSDYNDDRKISQGSAVRPLELNLGPKFEGQRLSNVVTGSPTIGQSEAEIREGLQAELQRAGSTSSRGSDGFEFSSSTTPATQTTTYTAAGAPLDKSRADTRSISSQYSARSGTGNPFFGSAAQVDPRTRKGSSGAPAPPKLNLRNYGDASRDSTSSAVTVFPGAESPKAHAFSARVNEAHASYGFPKPGTYFGDQHRDSASIDVTIFPGAPASNMGMPSIVPPSSRDGPLSRKHAAGEDLTWLNINAGKAI